MLSSDWSAYLALLSARHDAVPLVLEERELPVEVLGVLHLPLPLHAAPVAHDGLQHLLVVVHLSLKRLVHTDDASVEFLLYHFFVLRLYVSQ